MAARRASAEKPEADAIDEAAGGDVDDGISLTPEEKDESDEPEAGPTTETEPERQTRLEKRRDRRTRYLEEQEARKRAEQRASESDKRVAEALALVQRQQDEFRAYAAQQAQRGAPDPIDQENERIFREKQILDQEYTRRSSDPKNPITPKEEEEYRRKWHDLEGAAGELAAVRAMRRHGIQPPQQNSQQEVIRTQLTLSHPEVMGDQRAFAYADGAYRQLVAAGKNPQDLNTYNEAMEAAEKQFRMGKFKNGAPQPLRDPALRDKLQGTPRGVSAGSGDDRQRATTATPWMKRQAALTYPNIKDEAKRVQKWYATVGKGMEEDGVNLGEQK